MQSLIKRQVLGYLSLCKIQITRTVILTTAMGYYVAKLSLGTTFFDTAYDKWQYGYFFSTLFAISVICAGACALNHVVEEKSDAKMSRTKDRPIPDKIISKKAATIFGVGLIGAGTLFLYSYLPLLAICSLLTALFYDFVYTPLKKHTKWNTTIGAIPGALPIVGGWLAGGGDDLRVASVLFLILFIWQHPHFYAIAWMYRNDYAKAGYKMISLDDAKGQRTFLASVITAAVLIPLTIMLSFTVELGVVYVSLSTLVGLWFLAEVAFAAKKVSNRAARRIVVASVFYISLWFGAMLIDQSYKSFI